MTATLTVIHKTIGAEVRRGPYDVLVDGAVAGTVELNRSIDLPVEPGEHTLQVRSRRNSSHVKTFQIGDDEVVTYRCTGKSFVPIFLLSFLVPSLALRLHRE